MPYINQTARDEVLHNPERAIHTSGELNFVITCAINSYLRHHTKSYQYFNDCIGALEGAKLELYRRMIAPYEDTKIEQNGDVYNDRNAVLRSETEAGAKAA